MKIHYRVIAGLLVLPSLVSAQTQGPLPTTELRALADAFGVLRRSYVKPLSGEEILQGAIRGMLREVDPEAGEFLTKADIDDMGRAPGVADGAVGLEMLVRNNQVVVMSPIADSPGEKAGIRPGDVIDSIDGMPLKNNLRMAVRMLHGPVGSVASLELHTGADGPVRTMKIERKKVPAPHVRLSMATPDIASVKLTSFLSETLPSMANQVSDQWRKKPYKAIVLDLRRNTGGLLETSVGLAAFFLPPQSSIASTEGREPITNVKYVADPSSYSRGTDPFADVPAPIRQLPLVVLVDEGTANGAEIVVAALRDNKRARIVGRKTFGRTDIQMIQPLSNGVAIKFTAAYWYPPSHEALDRVGIVPDRLTPTVDPRREMDAAVAEARAMIQ
ncbi:S41 family peptidase [Cupriavidus sp. 8B]